MNNFLHPFLLVFQKISTNVTHLDCHLNISTWLTFVIMMLTAQTLTDPTIAHAGTDTLEMD